MTICCVQIITVIDGRKLTHLSRFSGVYNFRRRESSSGFRSGPPIVLRCLQRAAGQCGVVGLQLKGKLMKNAFARMWAVVLSLFVGVSAQAQSDLVTFPSLPSGDAWVSGLTEIFVAAAGLGLGILGLKLVIGMIKAGLARKR